MTPSDEVSLLGLGPMGEPMAVNLVRELGSLTVWNRTPERAERVVSLGARQATSPAEAAADVVLTVLPDLPQVEALLPGPDGLLAGWRAHGVERPVLVVHGTVSPVALREFAARLAAEHGVRVVDAPMSGGVPGAERGALSLMVGGDQAIVDSLRPVFDAVARTAVRMGEAGSGQIAKACNQIVVAGTIAALCEALALAELHGLSRADLVTALGDGLAGSEVLRQKSERWLTADYSGGGSARNQLKDLIFARDAANDVGAPSDVVDLVRSQFDQMVRAGDGDLDHSGLLRTITRP
ncbi:NAD(P)-dependent oxidoreductase [Prauserella rugosa]|uniref:2-hydroxy-3-oxopropionate reductase n=1 Tax=Prauserella rugosa TaxID=43354 RepID=A0A660CFL5_9PSEU|nr:NAD(P)-dependent oxidoreductase [Prauserella rugosa]KMS87177.1 2-hydroxy-3-oxopropionate reductase [Streptomyces regensis]TWH22136.1 2-hydroxy-3-oxopropionate reductase [Prauserella rugosa]